MTKKHEMPLLNHNIDFINDYILNGIADGQYSLLIGAGISYGVKNRNGQDIPLGNTLKEEIDAKYGIERPDYTLQQIAEVARELYQDDDNLLDNYLKDRFSGCKPTWHDKLLAIPWNIIWTLNVDDVLENAARNGINGTNLITKSYTWQDKYASDRSGVQQIVHIHGYVHHQPSPDFIFSLSDYANAVEERKTWHSIFRDTLPNKPFIIVGSRLSDEFDFQKALTSLSARMNNDLPTMYISPDIDYVTYKLMERRKVVMLKMTAEEFFTQIHQKVAEVKSKAKHDNKEFDFTFSQQFQIVPNKTKPPRFHDFFAGHEPTIIDIEQSKDAILENTQLLYEKSLLDYSNDAQGDESVTRLYVIDGMPGSGKTTALSRISYLLSQNGYNVFRFLEPEDIDIDAIVGYCSKKQLSCSLITQVAIDPQCKIFTRA